MGEWHDEDKNATRRLPPTRPDRESGAGEQSGGEPPASPPRPKPPSIRDPWREGKPAPEPPARTPPARTPPATDRPARTPPATDRPRTGETPVTGAPTEVFRKNPAAPNSPATGRPTPVERPAWQHANPPAAGAAPPPASGPDGAQAAGPRRRGRKLLIVGLVVVVLLAVLDRAVAAWVVPGKIVSAVRDNVDFPGKIDASAGGVPFLTQVVVGKYDDIGVTFHRVKLPWFCADEFAGHLQGVHLPVTKLLSPPKKLRADHVKATLVVDYADVNRLLANQPLHPQFAPDGNAAKVTVQVDTPIGAQTATANVQLGSKNQQLTVTIVGINLAGISVPVPSATLPLALPFNGLPFNVRVTGGKATAAGISVSLEADNVPLGGGSGGGGTRQAVQTC